MSEPLALWITPEAIREHYEAVDDLADLDDDDLQEVAMGVLGDDRLYRTFSILLDEHVGAVRDEKKEKQP